jgi:hypothetical protein
VAFNAVMVPMVSVIIFIVMVSMIDKFIIEFQVTFFARGIYFLMVTIITGVHSLQVTLVSLMKIYLNETARKPVWIYIWLTNFLFRTI